MPNVDKPKVLASIHDKTIVNDVDGMLDLGYWSDPILAEDICLMLHGFGVHARKIPWKPNDRR